ncbi:hypothetical protein M378DRAFT_627043 [Amanita muscaria Koide BX008]|uniref:Uncharacterized protein n=1 Tax=Amanita muscaria (strain Koide BX008) TaxID=946122 RepID=A0A0C2XLZ0_AMAMK|nr:hypothetical protein M378DRAFT_627043 [Amanita muscaria Koide BX008]
MDGTAPALEFMMLEERVAATNQKKDRHLTSRLAAQMRPHSSCWRRSRPSRVVKEISNQKSSVAWCSMPSLR